MVRLVPGSGANIGLIIISCNAKVRLACPSSAEDVFGISKLATGPSSYRRDPSSALGAETAQLMSKGWMSPSNPGALGSNALKYAKARP